MVRGTIYFEVECPGDNSLRSRVSGDNLLRSSVSGGKSTMKQRVQYTKYLEALIDSRTLKKRCALVAHRGPADTRTVG